MSQGRDSEEPSAPLLTPQGLLKLGPSDPATHLCLNSHTAQRTGPWTCPHAIGSPRVCKNGIRGYLLLRPEPSRQQKLTGSLPTLLPRGEKERTPLCKVGPPHLHLLLQAGNSGFLPSSHHLAPQFLPPDLEGRAQVCLATPCLRDLLLS